MASIYLRNEIWWIKFHDIRSNKSVRKSLKTKSKREARNALKDLEGRLVRGEYKHLRNVTIRAYMESHLRHIENDLRHNTIKSYRTSGKLFLDFLNIQGMRDINLRKISPELLKDFKAWRLVKVSGRTFNNDRIFLLALFNSAITDGYLVENPMRVVKRAREERSLKFGLSSEEIDLLCAELREEIARIVRFDVGTGLRKCELANLQWSDVHLVEKPYITVRNIEGARTKSRRERIVPLSPDMVRLLKIPNDFPYVFPKLQEKNFREHGLWKTVMRASQRAGIRRCTPHMLRHTFASNMIRKKNASLYVVSRLLGHSHSSTTENYAHLLDDDLHDAINR